MFDLSFDKLIVIGIIAVFLLGPQRLPHYAARLGRLVRTLRQMADGAKDRLREEMGPEFDEVDWKKLDPRQYDPRRIVREALIDDDDEAVVVVRPAKVEPASVKRQRMLSDGVDAPYDSEAT